MWRSLLLKSGLESSKLRMPHVRNGCMKESLHSLEQSLGTKMDIKTAASESSEGSK